MMCSFFLFDDWTTVCSCVKLECLYGNLFSSVCVLLFDTHVLQVLVRFD